jgi:hypothetical protein
MECLIYYYTVSNLLLYSAQSSSIQCLIYYCTIPNILPPCTECFSSARSSPSQSDSHCQIYYCTVPNLLLDRDYFPTVQCLIFYYTLSSLLTACTECFSSARSSPSQSDSHCLIYYCTVPNLLVYSA